MLRSILFIRKNVILQGSSAWLFDSTKAKNTRKLCNISYVSQILSSKKKYNLQNQFSLEKRRYKKMNPSQIPSQDCTCIRLVDMLNSSSCLKVDKVTEDLLSKCNYSPRKYIKVHLEMMGCPKSIEDIFVRRSDSKRVINWSTIYALSWPEHVYFEGIAPSKKAASLNAHLTCLAWLKKNYPYPDVFDYNCSSRSESLQQNGVKNRITVDTSFFRNVLVSTLSHNKQIDTNLNNLVMRNSVNTSLLSVNSILNQNKRTFSTQADNIEKDNPSVKKAVTEKIESNSPKQLIDDENIDVTKQPETHAYLKSIIQTFPYPKNTLNNIYDMLAKELNKKELKLNPQYKSTSKKGTITWNCTYNLKWPQVTSFTGTGLTKQEASRKASLLALSWLKHIRRINIEGQPIIFDDTESKELKRTRLFSLNLDQPMIDKMNYIVEEYQTKMLPYICQTKSKQKEDIAEEVVDEESLRFRNVNPKYLGLQAYIVKENLKLPISLYKDEFIQLLKKNRVLILKGEPGCGKSTRVPQYVLEHWAKEANVTGSFCRIAVTQPRRIAAISLAERVANERGDSSGNVVGYHVRLKSNFSYHTGRILYCTTGILLRHIQTDPSLKTFSHVILDEAHERDVNTDLLMNLLKKSMDLNPDLKLIIMSATIDTDIFRDYYNGAPVMVVPGFTHPVKSYFIDSCQKLNLSKTARMCESPVPTVIHQDVTAVIKYIHKNKPEGAILCFLPGWDDISRVRDMIPKSADMYVLCLHSRLQDSDQYKIFSRPPPGIRKVILATNIAETSVTIDDVVYVIDTGIHKESRFDVDKGVMCFDNYWISKASMTQRKGRAGRVQPGECFHLYTKAAFDTFEGFTLPEIMKTSLTKIVLDSKVYSNNMNAVKFMNQLLSPPEEAAVAKAVEELKELELLDEQENLTPLGKALADFQLEPKLSKALVNSVIFKCVTPVVDIVTLFSSETEFFTSGLVDKSKVKTVKRKYSPTSDHLALMRIFEKWVDLSERSGSYETERFCNEIGLASHKMITLKKLRGIHFDYLYQGLYDVLPISDDYSDNDELVKAVILCGVGNFLQHRNWDMVKGRYKSANVFLTKTDQRATITQESVNSKRTKFPSDVLIYINETRSNIRRTMVIRECSLISPITLLLFSNKDIIVSQAKDEKDPNLVQLSLAGTNFNALCNAQQARTLVNCKESIFAAYKFYSLLLTHGGDYNPKINECWDNILLSISDMLLKEKV